jgi:hypothetical protein
MSNDPSDSTPTDQPIGGASRLRGSLRDALAAASAPQRYSAAQHPVAARATPEAADAGGGEAGGDEVPQTRVVRHLAVRSPAPDAPAQTQRMRGKTAARQIDFFQDPVVGWLVIIGGPGLGAFRPVFEGNNTVGRSRSQRIPIDFGDEAISNEEQAYIRYDSVDRKFMLVPNMAKMNIVAVNDKKPTTAVELAAMDLITMGRTQLCFVPFCGVEFDWAELMEMKG